MADIIYDLGLFDSTYDRNLSVVIICHTDIEREQYTRQTAVASLNIPKVFGKGEKRTSSIFQFKYQGSFSKIGIGVKNALSFGG